MTFIINGVGPPTNHLEKEKKIDPFLTLYLRIHFKCIRNLNVNYKTTEALEENMSEFLIHL